MQWFLLFYKFQYHIDIAHKNIYTQWQVKDLLLLSMDLDATNPLQSLQEFWALTEFWLKDKGMKKWDQHW